jgi:hypothetical protein
MRLLHALLLIPLFSAPVLAETTSPAAEHHGRRSAAEHFTDANTSHDGRLTLDQAKAGYKSVAKSFAQIDAGHHGYITMDDIKAWKSAKKAAKHAQEDTTGSEGGVLRPAPAVHRGGTPRPLNTSTNLIVPMPADLPQIGVDLPNTSVDRAHSS